MAWVESHQELGRHPKVRRLALAAGIGVPQALGHLHLVWYWALDFAPDGGLGPYGAGDVEFAAGWDGEPGALFDALIEVRFIDITDDGLALHDWEVYAGRLMKVRAYNAERQRAYRERHKPQAATTAPKGRKGPAKAKTPAKATPTPAAGLDAFDAFWDAYPRKVEKAKARRIFLTRVKEGASADDMVAAAGHYRDWCLGSGQESRYIKHAATFVGPDRHFEEFVAGAPAAAGTSGKGLSPADIAGVFDEDYIEAEAVEV